MSEVAIETRDLGKRYRIGLEEQREDTLAATLTSWLKSPFSNYRRLRSLKHFGKNEADDVIWALRNVSFEVDEGAVMGVVGKNGAGKSTLLKILSKITSPTTGRVVLHGRVSSLLEVGTGFHPELTGRENVYLNGTILGMRKAEIDRKFDEIVDFSGVGRFLDTPVKRYSSGMQVRLAFSVAAHLEPEILLVDEVLSVGDAEFQRKCVGKMSEVAGVGRTVIFVSHNMGSLRRLCTTAMCLQDGKIVDRGDPGAVIRRYLDRTVSHEAFVELPEPFHRLQTPIQVRTIEMVASRKRRSSSFLYGEDIVVELGIEVQESMEDVQIGLAIDAGGTRIATLHTPPISCTPSTDLLSVACRIPGRTLLPGVYDLHVGARRGATRRSLDVVLNAASLLVSTAPEEDAMGDQLDRGYVRLPVHWRVQGEPLKGSDE